MNLIKSLTVIALITLNTFMYTHLRIEAVKYSYRINQSNIEIDKLLDQRRELEYNVARLKAPSYLEMQLAKSDVKMVLPKRWQVFEAPGLASEAIPRTMPLFVRNVVDLFSLRSEAQATPANNVHTIKPY
ncbi:MAG: hypothetical protein ABH875_02960 [Candidatus Omnitrophota bacterium]